MHTELDDQQKRLIASQQEAGKITAELKNVDATPRPEGVLQSLGSPAYIARVLLAAARQALHDARGALLAVLIWVVLGAAAYAAWRFAGPRAGSVATAVAVLAAPAIAVLRKLRAAHDKLLALADQQHTKLVASQKQAQRDVRDTERGIQDLKDRLVLIDAAEGLARFLDEHATGTAYREYRGLLGQVRADLDQLSASLEKAREQWARGGRFRPPPLQRIVLYIDDLDRCPPQRVVEVLEAIHLMLALDLFVVVVAVDARWLIRSLEYHHHELFRTADGHRDKRDRQPTDTRQPPDAAVRERDDEQQEEEYGSGLATPVDYLDKIFQVPFVLPPPKPEATALYLWSLLPTPVRAAPPGAAGTARRSADGGASRPEPAAGPVTAGPRPGADEAGTDQGSAGDNEPRQPATQDPVPDTASQPDDGAAASAGQDGRDGLDQPGPSTRSDGNPPADTGRETVRQTAAQAGEPAQASAELRPQGLQLTQAEADFMARLGGLLPTPRAAKRLVNIYRLARIGIPAPEMADFIGDEAGGPYQTVQVLLAILVGHPRFARDMFREVMSGHHGHDLAAVAEDVASRAGGAHSAGIVHPFLVATREKAPLAVSVELGRRWCPRLARFSFYTRELAGVKLDVADDTGDAAAGPQTVQNGHYLAEMPRSADAGTCECRKLCRPMRPGLVHGSARRAGLVA